MRKSICLWFIVLVVAANAPGAILGGHQLRIDFTKADAARAASWSEPDKIGITEKGLGWDGETNASRDGWIMTKPMGTGVSWRPTGSANVRLSITPAPVEFTLPNGQKSTPFPGWAYVRYSADAKHWSNWQAMGSAQPLQAPSAREYTGLLAIPQRERGAYGERLSDFSRRTDVPWVSDEEALAKELVKTDPEYFKNPIPFIGYVQFLFETGFYGGQRITGLTADVSFGVSGLSNAPKDPAAEKDRHGPWRFKVEGAIPTTNPPSP